MEVDHVGPEAAEHLGGDLPADSAGQAKLFAVKNSGWALSHPGSVIEFAHDTTAGRVVELRIGFGIAAVVGPVALLGRQQGRKCERDQQNQFFHGGRYFF